MESSFAHEIKLRNASWQNASWQIKSNQMSKKKINKKKTPKTQWIAAECSRAVWYNSVDNPKSGVTQAGCVLQARDDRVFHKQQFCAMKQPGCTAHLMESNIARLCPGMAGQINDTYHAHVFRREGCWSTFSSLPFKMGISRICLGRSRPRDLLFIAQLHAGGVDVT